MKCCCTLVWLIFLPFILTAQDLTGIWRGNFVNSSELYRERYKYEVQINELPDHSLQGVTYSYSYIAKLFYGKADLQGIYMDKTGNLIFKENKMLEYKVSDQSTPCLMTCYLQYHKENGVEYLEGTYSSIVTNSGRDCGSGKVYLERVENSDFTKESFLLKKKQPGSSRLHIKPGAAADLVSAQRPSSSSASRPPVAKPEHKTPADAQVKKQSAPVSGSNGVTRNAPLAQNRKKPLKDTASRLKPADASIASINPGVKDAAKPVSPIEKKPVLPVPQIIRDRENRLVKTIVTHSPDIRIQLYDNGEIDDDTITVYHNNEVVVYKKRLSYDPITINIATTPDNPVHELVMVADNLGRIPPNTALMVVTTGGKRYELFITSTEQRNAKVVIEYKPG